jgi:hypothetical protein
MDDEDPNKRCFHCVFTNCKGTDGALGLITPELFEALFTEPDVKKSKSHRHHHKSKRPRTQEPRKEEERLDGNKIDKIIPIPRKATTNRSSNNNNNDITEEQGQQTMSDPAVRQEMNDDGDSSAQDTDDEASVHTENSK